MCDTIQSLCEYFLMTYSSLIEEIFLKRTPGVCVCGGGGGGGSTPYIGLYREAPPKRNTLFGLHVYKKKNKQTNKKMIYS